MKAINVESDERIHRSDLVGMVGLPLQFANGQIHEAIVFGRLRIFAITGITGKPTTGARYQVSATTAYGNETQTIEVVCRLHTRAAVDYDIHGEILQFVLRNLLPNG